MLGGVEGLVGLTDQEVRPGRAVLGVQGADARADGDFEGTLAVGDRAAGNSATDAFDGADGLAGVGVRHQDDDFVAPVACDEVGRAGAVLERLGDLHKNPVAEHVAAAVVDRLEAVHVDHGEGEIGPVTPCPFRFQADGFHEPSAVRQARQVVRRGEFLEARVGLFQRLPDLLALDGIAYRTHQEPAVELPFDQIVLRAPPNGLNGHGLIIQDGQDDCGNPRRMSEHGGQRIESRALREGKVQQHKVNVPGVQMPQPFLKALGPLQMEAATPLFRQEFPDQAGVPGVVLYQ